MMKIKKISCQNQQGLSNLLLVFIVASLLTLVILILQLNSLLSARRAAQVQYSQAAFFAAEGALYEIIRDLRGGFRPTSFPDTTRYPLGGAEILRVIEEPEEDTLKISITADVYGARRKLIGYYKLEEEDDDEEPVEPSDPSCAGLTVDVEFGDLTYHNPSINPSLTIGEGDSWVTKAGGAYTTRCNQGPGDITRTNGHRKWLCDGTCPDFDWFYDNVGSENVYEDGATIYLGDVAILDDDFGETNERYNCFVLVPEEITIDIRDCPLLGYPHSYQLCECVEFQAGAGGKILHECDPGTGWLSEPCEYTLQSGESGKIMVLHEDSVGVDRQPIIITATGETFWFEEVEPEPEPSPTP